MSKPEPTPAPPPVPAQQGVVVLPPSVQWSTVGGLHLEIFWTSPDTGGQFILDKSADNTTWEQDSTWNPSTGGAVFTLKEPDYDLLGTAWRMRYITR